MPVKSEDLGEVYGASSPDGARRLYDDWSGSYDADNLRKGFRLPALAAAMLARHLGTEDGPLLDAACGTGLVGETLSVLGYGPITGCDLSPDMLAQAGKTGAYAALDVADMSESLPYDDDHFAAFLCIGSFGPGHAPPQSLLELVRVTRPGGFGVFNLGEGPGWETLGFAPVMADLEAAGQWTTCQVTAPFRPYLLAEPDLAGRLYAFRIT